MLVFVFTDQFFRDRIQLQAENLKLIVKLFDLLGDINKDPYSGIGKLEPLKGNLSGCWSRRINDKHRLIYKVQDNKVMLISCYGHYDDR